MRSGSSNTVLWYGVQFLLPKKYKLWGKVLTKKRLYDISPKRRRRLQSELTNHTTKINKLESWKKEIDDSIFRLNHFQNIDNVAGLVGYSKCESIVLSIRHQKNKDAKLSFEKLCRDFGVVVKTYMSDNGSAFTSKDFTILWLISLYQDIKEIF